MTRVLVAPDAETGGGPAVGRLPVAAFSLLVLATIAAFFLVQHLKSTTPLIAGFPKPDPAVIDPRARGGCEGVSAGPMRISFYLLHRSDDVDVYVTDQSGAIVATLATSRYMRARPPERVQFSWSGREDGGRIAPDGLYDIRVELIHQGRSYVVADQDTGALEPVRVQTIAACASRR